MTIPAEQPLSTILATSQQTRFHINENDASREIDLKGVNITVASTTSHTGAIKAGRKSHSNGLEILNNAHLRVKSGVHYGLTGRNGSGKSILLKAIADKLIPGLHKMNLRIAALQQTDNGENESLSSTQSNPTVLETVLMGDNERNQTEYDLELITKAINSTDAMDCVRALRKRDLIEAEQKLTETRKEASLRSGARGFDIRKKALPQSEQEVETMQKLYGEDSSAIDAGSIEKAAQDASQLQIDLQIKLDSFGTSQDLEQKAKQILAGLGFKETQLGQPFKDLSGGWKMRCKLAATLTKNVDLLILDEPTNYLDLLGILWLQHYLIELETDAPQTALLLVSHDRDFINETCSELIMLREKNLSYFQGNLDSYDKSIRSDIKRLTRMKEAQDKQRTHMEKTISENMRQGKKTGDDNKLRQAKSRQLKLDDRMGMQVSAKGGRFKLNRDMPGYYSDGKRAAIEIPKEDPAVKMIFPPASDLRFPGSLLSLENASLKYKNAPKPTLQDVNLVVHPGDRLGILGLNGAGKSTLVQVLMGKLPLSGGTMSTHPRLKVGYYSQHAVDEIIAAARSDPSVSALSLLQGRAEDIDILIDEPDARKLLGSMGLPGRTASDTPVARLSGGQLVRLAISILLLDPPQLFVLDEPTTHLDMPTIDALAGALKTYDGAIVLVTHDRFFLRTVIQGERVDDRESDSDDSEAEDAAEASPRRRVVYELKGSKLTRKENGMDEWEDILTKRLEKLRLV